MLILFQTRLLIFPINNTMIEIAIFWLFLSALLTLLVGVGLILVIRRKTQSNLKENKPAGFWVRLVCFCVDLAIIDMLKSFLAYHGSLVAAGYITILIALSYFFFFWIFFSATPAMMLARIRILSKNGAPLKIWQILTRLAMFIFLFISWIPMLFDKKQKRALHDIVAQTRVAYAEKEKKVETNSGWVQRVKIFLLVLVLVLLIGLIVTGGGEKLTRYTENNQITFFDLNKDGISDGLTMDVDKDGKSDVFKYDLNNDHVVDFTTIDADKDGIAESIDINNDGRIDGFDFDNDNVLDIKVTDGQRIILLWKVMFGIWVIVFAALLAFGIIKERKQIKKH